MSSLRLVALFAFASCAQPADEEVAVSQAKVSPNVEQGPLPWGTTVTGAVDSTTPYHHWTFHANKDDVVSLALDGLKGKDPFLVVVRISDNYLVGTNDDCVPGTNSSCLALTLDAEADYRVVVSSSRYAATGRPSSLSYRLTLTCGNASGTCDGIEGRGCDDGQSCPSGYLCEHADACAGAGRCTAIGALVSCPRLVDEVCGCDGVTYANECAAHAMGVSVSAPGACDYRQGEGQTCGGIAGLQCHDGLECDYSGNVGCNIADMGGACRISGSLACTMQYDPVCGCDGLTYGNDCLRRAAGVPLDDTGGACLSGIGEQCGGSSTNLQCATGLVCDFSQSLTCDLASIGTCVEDSAVFCLSESSPVCGCDGITYLNECFRRVANVALAHEGPCST